MKASKSCALYLGESFQNSLHEKAWLPVNDVIAFKVSVASFLRSCKYRRLKNITEFCALATGEKMNEPIRPQAIHLKLDRSLEFIQHLLLHLPSLIFTCIFVFLDKD